MRRLLTEKPWSFNDRLYGLGASDEPVLTEFEHFDVFVAKFLSHFPVGQTIAFARASGRTGFFMSWVDCGETLCSLLGSIKLALEPAEGRTTQPLGKPSALQYSTALAGRKLKQKTKAGSEAANRWFIMVALTTRYSSLILTLPDGKKNSRHVWQRVA